MSEKLKFNIKEAKMSDKSATMLIQNVRLAFVSIAKPNTRFADRDENGQPVEGSYEVTCLIPKSDEQRLSAQLKKSVLELIENSDVLKTAQDKQKAQKTALALHGDGSLIKDGDKIVSAEGQIYDGLENHLVIKAKTKAVFKDGKFSPKVSFAIRRANKMPIEAHELDDEIYSGVWADVLVNLVPYKAGKNIGVACYLNGIMKLMDDTKLGGADLFEDRSDIADPFDTDDTDEEF